MPGAVRLIVLVGDLHDARHADEIDVRREAEGADDRRAGDRSGSTGRRDRRRATARSPGNGADARARRNRGCRSASAAVRFDTELSSQAAVVRQTAAAEDRHFSPPSASRAVICDGLAWPFAHVGLHERICAGAECASAFDREWPWGVARRRADDRPLASAIPAALVDARRARLRSRSIGMLLPRAAGESPRVVVIDIDRESLARIGPWPWRRSLIADLVEQVVGGRRRAPSASTSCSPARTARAGGARARSSTPMSGRPPSIDASRFRGRRPAAGGRDRRGRQCRARPRARRRRAAIAPPFPAPLAVEGTTEGIVAARRGRAARAVRAVQRSARPASACSRSRTACSGA